MNKNPFLNALTAAAYIVVIVLVMNVFGLLGIQDNSIIIPMTMLSLLVLSVTIMGLLFFVEPLRLYFENQKQEALTFFTKTIGYFACFVGLFVVILILTIWF